MNKKAFSKVGVLAVLLVVAVLAFVAFPKVKNALQSNQTQELVAAKPAASAKKAVQPAPAPAQAAAPAPAQAAAPAPAQAAAANPKEVVVCDMAIKPNPVVTPCGFCGKSTINYVCNPVTKRWDAKPTGCVIPDGYSNVCTPGTKAEIPCGAFSKKSRVCTEKCAWSAWSECVSDQKN